MNVRILGEARGDVLDAADWYNRMTPGRGDRFLAAVDGTVARIGRRPRAYGYAPRQPRGHEVRQVMVRGYQYKITYEVTPTEVVVLSVSHARSKRQPWRKRLGP